MGHEAYLSKKKKKKTCLVTMRLIKTLIKIRTVEQGKCSILITFSLVSMTYFLEANILYQLSFIS